VKINRIATTVTASVAIAALLLTYFTYPPNGYVSLVKNTWIVGLLTVIEFPSLFFGILVSGNAHQPDAVTMFGTLFLTYLLILGGTVWFVGIALKGSKT
jgi:hypothetical protein